MAMPPAFEQASASVSVAGFMADGVTHRTSPCFRSFLASS